MTRPLIAVIAVVVALVAAVAFAAFSWFILGHTWDVLEYDQPLVVYNTPVGVALVLWAFDVDWRKRRQAVIAALVICAALLRSRIIHPWVHIEVPWSGHALFLAFALGTSRSWWVRAVCAAVIVQVVVLKVRFEDTSWIAGLALGAAAAGACRWRA